MHRRFARRGRALLALLCALSLLLALASSALAAGSPDPSAEGEPTVESGRPPGYYIWHDQNGFHLRTHGPGQEHRFEARLHSDGTFVDVDTVRLESRDAVALRDGGHTLVLKFHTYDATDGVNFRVRDGERLRFALDLDGQPIGTDSIYIGRDGHHPPTNPFTIRI